MRRLGTHGLNLILVRMWREQGLLCILRHNNPRTVQQSHLGTLDNKDTYSSARISRQFPCRAPDNNQEGRVRLPHELDKVS